MRISETLRLTLDQYDGKYFRNVKRKGKRRDDVYVSPEARAALADYFEHERGTGPGPLFQSRDGTAMLRKDADRYLKQIAAMANANVPEEERVNLHAHLMRHTALKQAEAEVRPGVRPEEKRATSGCSTSSGTCSPPIRTTKRRWTGSIRRAPPKVCRFRTGTESVRNS